VGSHIGRRPLEFGPAAFSFCHAVFVTGTHSYVSLTSRSVTESAITSGGTDATATAEIGCYSCRVAVGRAHDLQIL
jgi:hypothetical protein